MAAGQLSNIYLIQDPVLVKQAMLQTIQVLKDATSLPWQAVRTAYAQSMHKVEQGTMQWQDTTQWALHRISSSQIVMANATSLNFQQSNKKSANFIMSGCVRMREIMGFTDIYVAIVLSQERT